MVAKKDIFCVFYFGWFQVGRTTDSSRYGSSVKSLLISQAKFISAQDQMVLISASPFLCTLDLARQPYNHVVSVVFMVCWLIYQHRTEFGGRPHLSTASIRSAGRSISTALSLVAVPTCPQPADGVPHQH
ncbi:hypothetical protein RRG08_052467 [Elysia crispata]|uniref:Uncharacterized protein n=1 Tax=Elysia crispata TaxID=231223 RepID=A0AAE1B1J1_9GAST|nr:hypothetical protein RRG08_052467 [Elysia crispata]